MHIVLDPLDLMARLAALVPQPRMEEGADETATPRQVAMSWARRLKRVFGIDIEACARCGCKLKVIASMEEPEVIVGLRFESAWTW